MAVEQRQDHPGQGARHPAHDRRNTLGPEEPPEEHRQRALHRLGPARDEGARRDPAELGPVIDELLAEGPAPEPVRETT